MGKQQLSSQTQSLIERALRGDLTGMNFIILVRMSNESKKRKRKKDRAAGKGPKYRTGLDVENREVQIARCTRDIESRGGTVVDVYEEPHTSAYKRRKMRDADGNVYFRVVRPVFQQALKDLKRGISKSGHRVDGMMGSDADRIVRDPRDLEDCIDAMNYSGRPIIELTYSIDLLTVNGRTNARVIVAFKNGQSADTARRTREMHEELQSQGIPTGGSRPFGWMEDKRTLHPVESQHYKAALRQVREGRSRSAITAEWNKKGITTPRGGKWDLTNFTMMLRNPRAAGYRMMLAPRDPANPDSPRYPVIVRDHKGKPVIGQWERMCTPKEWEEVLAIIGERPEPDRRPGHPERGSGANSRVYLCAGTLRCGKCDHLLRATKAQPSDHKPAGFFYYTCPAKSAGGCGGIKVPGPDTDEAVAEIVITLWEREAARRGRARTEKPKAWERAAELEMVTENMAALKAARKAGTISAERYYADLGEYEAEQRALNNERTAFLRQTAKAAPVNLRRDWDTDRFTLTDRRGYVEQALSAVVVAGVGRGRRVPVEDRLTPVPAIG